MHRDRTLADRFLRHLGVPRDRPTVDTLHRLVGAHQHAVRWETLTKIIDAEELEQSGSVLPEIGVYIERIIERGGGGTCWTHARGFHWLLTELGFEAHYIYMDSGHLCLRVELDQPWYADVGYGAPLFRAYPLLESFTIEHPQERFVYRVRESDVLVTRDPGPEKVLELPPRRFEDFTDRIADANIWREGSFLTRLELHGYIDGVATRLSENRLRRWHPGGATEQVLDDLEIRDLLAGAFRFDPDIYFRAREIRAARMVRHGIPAYKPPNAAEPARTSSA